MRILLDACLPIIFRHELVNAGVVETAKYAGLAHLSNGALLAAMVGRFDVLITVDASLRYQNSIVGRPVSVIVLRVASNDIDDLRPLVGLIMRELLTLGPGQVIEI